MPLPPQTVLNAYEWNKKANSWAFRGAAQFNPQNGCANPITVEYHFERASKYRFSIVDQGAGNVEIGYFETTLHKVMKKAGNQLTGELTMVVQAPPAQINVMG